MGHRQSHQRYADPARSVLRVHRWARTPKEIVGASLCRPGSFMAVPKLLTRLPFRYDRRHSYVFLIGVSPAAVTRLHLSNIFSLTSRISRECVRKNSMSASCRLLCNRFLLSHAKTIRQPVPEAYISRRPPPTTPRSALSDNTAQSTDSSDTCSGLLLKLPWSAASSGLGGGLASTWCSSRRWTTFRGLHANRSCTVSIPAQVSRSQHSGHSHGRREYEADAPPPCLARVRRYHRHLSWGSETRGASRGKPADFDEIYDRLYGI